MKVDKTALVLGVLAVGGSVTFVGLRLALRSAVRESLREEYHLDPFKYGVAFLLASETPIPPLEEPSKEYVYEAIDKLVAELVPIASLSLPSRKKISAEIEGKAIAAGLADPSALIKTPWIVSRGIGLAQDALLGEPKSSGLTQ